MLDFGPLDFKIPNCLDAFNFSGGLCSRHNAALSHGIDGYAKYRANDRHHGFRVIILVQLTFKRSIRSITFNAQ